MNDIFDEINIPEKKNILDKLENGTEIEKTIIPLFQITYNESSGFGAYLCEDEGENRFDIKGVFVHQLTLGQTYLIEGSISSYKSKYGEFEKQISVRKIRNIKPVNKKGIIAYLQTLKGLKKRAYDIYDIYGDKSIDVLINNPIKVANTLKGIGKKSVLDWKSQLEKMKDNQEILLTLLNFGLTAKESKQLYKKYGDVVVKKIKDNPYILSKEVKGFGFLKCDRIARNLGYPPESSNRLQEGIIYALEEATNNGHCYLPYEELMETSINLLNIKLTGQEMNNFRSKYKANFVYKIGKNSYKIDYDKMTKNLNSYNAVYGRNRDRYKYTVINIPDGKIKDELKLLVLQNRIIIEDDKIYLENYYDAEHQVSTHVNRIINSKIPIPWDVETKLNSYCKNNLIELEDKQIEAVIKFSQSIGGFYILNGSAGCGKTFTLKVILKMLDIMYKNIKKSANILLLAPTGKAAKVATKATGMECKTIHRGLKYNPEFGFEYNENNPLEEDIIIVDESSMLDIMLARHLFSAVKSGAKVILLGDTKQLPSVGAGNVLSDLINSDKIDIVTLNVIKRQGSQSGIIKNANAIIKEKMIETRNDTKDAYIIKRETPKGVQDAIIQSIKRLQVKGYSFSDIQLLCPQKGGLIGTEYMNYLLQKIFNPGNDGIKVLNKKLNLKFNYEDTEITKINLYFKKGDKVIHIKNNYNMPWYKKVNSIYELMGENYIGITNGECGVIEEIRKGTDDEGNTIDEVIVKYDGMYIIYKDGVKELDHAYALTIHKSQGSQFPAVIIPIMMVNYIMLDNNLFYTAYTRAEKFIVTIGEEKAIKHAIKTHKSRYRHTNLKELL